MSTRPRTPASDDLRLDLLADLAGPGPLPGSEPLPTAPPAAPAAPAARRVPALEVRLTPTRWAVSRTAHGLRVGPWSVALTRD